MFKKYKIGNSEYNNGVLILLSTVDRKIRIEVGYGLGEILSDYRAGRIIDSHIHLLKTNDFDSAISKIFNDVSYEICSKYDYDIPNLNVSKTIKKDILDTLLIYSFIIIVLIVKIYQVIDFIKNPEDRNLISFILFDFLHLGLYNRYFRKRNSKGSGFGGGGSSGYGGSSRSF